MVIEIAIAAAEKLDLFLKRHEAELQRWRREFESDPNQNEENASYFRLTDTPIELVEQFAEAYHRLIQCPDQRRGLLEPQTGLMYRVRVAYATLRDFSHLFDEGTLVAEARLSHPPPSQVAA